MSYARAMTLALLASSVAGNVTVHALTAYRIVPPWWLVVAVSAVPPVVLGATVHLAVLVGRPARKPTPGSSDDRRAAPVGSPDTLAATEWERRALDPGEPGELPGDAGEPAGGDRAAVLIAEGAGRRRLAAELGISERDDRTNGVAR